MSGSILSSILDSSLALVFINCTSPKWRTCFSSLGNLEGVRISIISLMCHLVLQERDSWHMWDLLVQTLLISMTSRLLVSNYTYTLRIQGGQFLCLMIMTLSHHDIYGRCIIFYMMYYVDTTFQWPQLIRWLSIILWQFYIALDRYHSVQEGRRLVPFSLELFLLFFGTFFNHYLVLSLLSK